MIDYSRVINPTVAEIKPSGIRKFFDIASTMDDVISLGVGEPDFQTPWQIRKAGINSLEKGHTKYTANRGIAQLRSAVADFVSRKYSLTYKPESEILITVGGSEAIDACIRAAVAPGDEVIIPQPSFVCYEPITRLAGGTPVILETKAENDFKVTSEELAAAISERTKLLILPYPCNPTGAIMEKSDLEKIAEILKGTNILVLSDEIYSELTFGGEKHVSPASIDGMWERTVSCSSLSKTYSVTGWRLGYAIAPKPLMDRIKQYHDFNAVGAASPLMEAACVGLNMPDSYYEEFGAHYAHMKKLFTEGLDRIGIPYTDPQGAYFVLADIAPFLKPGQSDVDFCLEMAQKVGVACVPGTSFFNEKGINNIVRVHFAKKDETLNEALERLSHIKEKMG